MHFQGLSFGYLRLNPSEVQLSPLLSLRNAKPPQLIGALQILFVYSDSGYPASRSPAI